MKVLDAVTARDNRYTGSNPATPDQAGDVRVLDFDSAVDEFGGFDLFLPDSYGGGGLTFEVYGQASSATSGNFAWEIAISALTPGTHAPATKGFAAVQSSGAVVTPATAGIFKKATVLFTPGAQMDNWVAGQWAKVRINRDTGIGGNMAGDLEFYALVMKETGT